MAQTRDPGRRRPFVIAIGLIALVGIAIAVVAGAMIASTPRPVVSGRYGPGIAMDSLANTVIGGPQANEAAFRFRASTSAVLDSILIYIMGGEEDGYGQGTGGLWEVTVQANGPDNMPSGTVLASTTYRPATGADQTVAWDQGASLVAGTIYHIVFRNIDPDPAANFASINGAFLYEPPTPRQPRFSDVEWGHPLRSDGGPWADRERMVPIMQLTYGDGTTDGMGYMEVWIRSHREISGTAMARQSLKPTDVGRLVSSISVRLMRLSGESPLSITLQKADGSVLETGSISAASIPVGVPGIHDGDGHAAWTTYAFAAPHRLESDADYDLILSAPSDTIYSTFVLRQGSRFGFAPSTYFGDGRAWYTSDGHEWGEFGGGPAGEGDLQFYFD